MIMVLTLSHILSTGMFRQRVTHLALITEDHHRTLQRATTRLSVASVAVRTATG
jgi:hypothetical protein